jgi:hypothetical protein
MDRFKRLRLARRLGVLRLRFGQFTTRNDTEYLLRSPRNAGRLWEAREEIARGEGIEVSSLQDLARLVGFATKR